IFYMNKLAALVSALLFLVLPAYSQSTTASISYNKTSQPGLMLELPYNQDVSEGFIVTNLKKTGYEPETKGSLFWKNNKINGFYTFKGVSLPGADQPVDLYFKVDKKKKDQSVIYMLVSKGGENFINQDSSENLYTAGKNFLDGFLEQSAVYKLDLDIRNQQNSVNNAQKKLDRLRDDEKSLNKKLEQLQSDLKKNQQDQEKQQQALENEQKKLSDLKARKSN
ncbi:MAG: hypothetical protein ACXVBR_13975, partial [Flavisolibacter sp.]